MEVRERIQQVMEQAVGDSVAAGVNLLVERDGKELLYAQAGYADRESCRRMERDAIFRLYSQTKPVTAAAAMILMERGEIDLCQSVGEFLPAYRKLRVAQEDGRIAEAACPLTIHNLLNMTSGLYYPEEGSAAGRAAEKVFREACGRMGTGREMGTRELAERLGEGPLGFEPGSSWKYGSSADVLGAVIEVVTGKSLAEFLEEEIFKPLGMEDTAFYVPEEKRKRLAKVYGTVEDGEGKASLQCYTESHLAISNPMDRMPAFLSGGAGLASTLDDYMKFARMLLGGGSYGGRRILNPRTVRYLVGGELLPDQQRSFNKWVGLEGYSYGNFMRVCKNPAQATGLARAGEYGWDGWLGVYFANFPEENMTILIGTQKKDGGTFPLTKKLRNLVLGNF